MEGRERIPSDLGVEVWYFYGKQDYLNRTFQVYNLSRRFGVWCRRNRSLSRRFPRGVEAANLGFQS